MAELDSCGSHCHSSLSIKCQGGVYLALDNDILRLQRLYERINPYQSSWLRSHHVEKRVAKERLCRNEIEEGLGMRGGSENRNVAYDVGESEAPPLHAHDTSTWIETLAGRVLIGPNEATRPSSCQIPWS